MLKNILRQNKLNMYVSGTTDTISAKCLHWLVIGRSLTRHPRDGLASLEMEWSSLTVGLHYLQLIWEAPDPWPWPLTPPLSREMLIQLGSVGVGDQIAGAWIDFHCRLYTFNGASFGCFFFYSNQVILPQCEKRIFNIRIVFVYVHSEVNDLQKVSNKPSYNFQVTKKVGLI